MRKYQAILPDEKTASQVHSDLNKGYQKRTNLRISLRLCKIPFFSHGFNMDQGKWCLAKREKRLTNWQCPVMQLRKDVMGLI